MCTGTGMLDTCQEYVISARPKVSTAVFINKFIYSDTGTSKRLVPYR